MANLFTDYPDSVSADLASYEAKQRKWFDRLPKCDVCGQPIQGTHYYEINDEKVCADCIEDEFKRTLEVDFD